MVILPTELANKIMMYNMHPIADLFINHQRNILMDTMNESLTRNNERLKTALENEDISSINLYIDYINDIESCICLIKNIKVFYLCDEFPYNEYSLCIRHSL